MFIVSHGDCEPGGARGGPADQQEASAVDVATGRSRVEMGVGNLEFDSFELSMVADLLERFLVPGGCTYPHEAAG